MSRTLILGGVGCCFLLGVAGCGGSPPRPAGGSGEPTLPPTPAAFVAGESLYDSNCGSCHNSSRDGAPRLGFLRAWKGRLEQGEETLVRNAIDGLDLMPPRGDNPDLTDDDIRSVVAYMVYRAELDIPAKP